MESKVSDWIDRFWVYMDSWFDIQAAIVKVCFDFQLSSWEEDLLKDKLKLCTQ